MSIYKIAVMHGKKVIFVAALGVAAAFLFVASRFETVASAGDIEYGVLYSCSAKNNNVYSFKVISCDAGWCQVFIVNEASPHGGNVTGEAKTTILSTIKNNSCTTPGGNHAEVNAEPAGTAATMTEKEKKAEDRNHAQFKVGDRVLASPLFMDGDKYWWACTITDTSHVSENAYGIRCDPQGGVSYKNYTVQPKWVKAAANLPAAPKYDCSFDVPQGKASNAAAPSAQLFKLVIYEKLAAAEKARMGVNFTTFQMGRSYKNLLTGRGLMDAAAPQNAMVYTVKTQYTTCIEGTSDFNYRAVTKANFACFKDKFGDWVCGGDSGGEFLEHQSVPKDQTK